MCKGCVGTPRVLRLLDAKRTAYARSRQATRGEGDKSAGSDSRLPLVCTRLSVPTQGGAQVRSLFTILTKWPV